MFVAISAARNCQYCTTAHLAFCALLGVDAATLTLLDTNIDAIEPQRTREALRFAVHCATDPGSLTAADYDVLRGQGITDAEIVEMVAMAAFSVYATIVADALHVDIDTGFHAILQEAKDAGAHP
jgi:alkylhydroperoxidase family enzyme